jgi:hypothetical protein
MSVTSTGYAVFSLTELRAISDLPVTSGGLYYKLFVYSEGRDYYYDSTVSSGGVAPTSNVGRWFPCTRQILRANRIYYVRTDGSDSNTGLVNSSGGAFLTIQKAVDVVAAELALNSTYTTTIQLVDGTYSITSPITLRQLVGGNVILKGNTSTPANVVISGNTSGYCFSATGDIAGWTLQDFQLSNSSGGGIQSIDGSAVSFQNINFSTCTNNHLFAGSNGNLRQIGNYSVIGATNNHLSVNYGAIIASGFTVTITGTPAFSVAYALARNAGFIDVSGTTFTGSATGVRYDVRTNSVIDTNSGGASFIPGNSAGTTATGGQYV